MIKAEVTLIYVLSVSLYSIYTHAYTSQTYMQITTKLSTYAANFFSVLAVNKIEINSNNTKVIYHSIVATELHIKKSKSDVRFSVMKQRKCVCY